MAPYRIDADEPIGHLVNRTARAMGAHLQKRFADEGYDVSAEQWVILINLARQQGQFQQQIADHTYKDKAAVTRLLHGLEKRKLVKRSADRDDRRQKRLFLTPLGEALVEKLIDVAFAAQGAYEKGIDPADMAVCKKVILAIYRNATGTK